MIILRLQGGMGNQMFQYAAAKAVALRLGTELLLDLGWYHSGTVKQGRVYSLGNFPNLKERTATFREVFALAPWQAIENILEHKYLSRCLYRKTLLKLFLKAGFLPLEENLNAGKKSLFEPIPFSRIYKQRRYEWTAELEALSDGAYMMGYWESEKFFHDKHSEIRSLFGFSPDVLNSPLGKDILSQHSVAVHVRRGDKLKTSGFLPTDPAYIKEAVLLVSSKIQDPRFFVFSDDIAWCKKFLPSLCDVRWSFVEGSTSDNAYRDLCLMASCCHNIVGTSTFSWWGAWLNRNPQKIVVAPHQSLWFSCSDDSTINTDLLCDDWIVLD